MPSLKHIHTYAQYKTRPGYFRCEDPDCTHFMDKAMVAGKRSRCCGCGSEFILTKDDLRRVRPLGPCCSQSAKAKESRSVRSFVDELIDKATSKEVRG